MRTVIVSAGCSEHRRWAARLIQRAAALNDVPCLDLSDVARWNGLTHPTWVKTQIWDLVPSDTDRVVWLDADIFSVRRMPLEDVPEDAAFSAVPEADDALEHEMKKMGSQLAVATTVTNAGTYPVEDEEMNRRLNSPREKEKREKQKKYEGVLLRAPYCNAGVFVATRETEGLFRELGKRMKDDVQGCFLDQSWLNALLSGDINPLPKTWNWMIDSDDPPNGVINVHAAGLAMHEVVKVLRAMYAAGGSLC